MQDYLETLQQLCAEQDQVFGALRERLLHLNDPQLALGVPASESEDVNDWQRRRAS